MASTNQSPKYKEAELKFLNAKTNEEKMVFLEEMIRECPKHKSSEKMLANLKTRYIKLKEKIETQKKTSKGTKKTGIKKKIYRLLLSDLHTLENQHCCLCLQMPTRKFRKANLKNSRQKSQ